MPFFVFYRESEPEEDFYSADWDAVPDVGEVVELPPEHEEETNGPYSPTLERFVVKRREWADYTRRHKASVDIYVTAEKVSTLREALEALAQED